MKVSGGTNTRLGVVHKASVLTVRTTLPSETVTHLSVTVAGEREKGPVAGTAVAPSPSCNR